MMDQTGSTQEKFFVALVDDEERIHNFLRSALEAEGILRRHASFFDPVSFVEYMKQCDEEPDIILLDIHFENSGLSGTEILPFIREDYPYLPIILLTGMDNDALQGAQEYPCVYFIPKPVSPEHLVRMIRFYIGKSKKSSEMFQRLDSEILEYKEYQRLLEEEIASLQTTKEEDKRDYREKKEKSFQRISGIFEGLLQHSEIMPSFFKDLEDIFDSNYSLFKKVMEILIRFDVMDASSPGLNIHKHKGTENIYSARLSKKVRLFFYLPPAAPKRRLLRLDTVHDTKGMDRWIKDNYKSYA